MFGTPTDYTQRAGALLGQSTGYAPPRNTFSRSSVPDMHYYDLLGVPHTASKQDIQKAFVEARRRYHPDHATGSSALFFEAQEAIKVLGNDSLRKAYDTYGMAGVQQMGGASSSSSAPAADPSGGGFGPVGTPAGSGGIPSWGGSSLGGKSGRGKDPFNPFGGVSTAEVWGASRPSLDEFFAGPNMFDPPTSSSSSETKTTPVQRGVSSADGPYSRIPTEEPLPGPSRLAASSPSFHLPQPHHQPAVVHTADVKVTLAELRYCQDREVEFRIPLAAASENCESCSGKGQVSELGDACNDCGGTGEDEHRASLEFQLGGGGGRRCRWCQGTGRQKLQPQTCVDCGGSGQSKRGRTQSEGVRTHVARVQVRAGARNGEVVSECDLGNGQVGRAVVREEKHSRLRREKDGNNLWVVSRRYVEGKGWEVGYLDESDQNSFYAQLPVQLRDEVVPGDVVKVEGKGCTANSNLYVVLRPTKDAKPLKCAPKETLPLVRLTPTECSRYNVPTAGLRSRRHDIEESLDLP